MNVLKFKLEGRTAFFKKPDVNSILYFTYGNIHKVALLGIFGAILGYGGYNQFKFKLENNKNYKEHYPEFYTKLKDIKVAIEPLNEKAFISKKVQVFNNSVGYASQEKGGNLIVKEQWLENPKWDIYLLLDTEEANKICDSIVNNKAVFQPYLGKNDHFAKISRVEIFDNVDKIEKVNKINSLCPKKCIEFTMESSEDDESEEDLFRYSERLPLALTEATNMYELESFVYSNMEVKCINYEELYNINSKNIVFF